MVADEPCRLVADADGEDLDGREGRGAGEEPVLGAVRSQLHL